jgi:hypothetical protein
MFGVDLPFELKQLRCSTVDVHDYHEDVWLASSALSSSKPTPSSSCRHHSSCHSRCGICAAASTLAGMSVEVSVSFLSVDAIPMSKKSWNMLVQSRPFDEHTERWRRARSRPGSSKINRRTINSLVCKLNAKITRTQENLVSCRRMTSV